MSQVFHKLYYHIVWATRNREALIHSGLERILTDYITRKIIQIGAVQLSLNMTVDHVHLLVSIPPKISIADFVNKVKGSSSHYLNLRQRERDFYWQSGYGILSLSEKGIPFVRQYIQQQKKKHKNDNLLDILECTVD